MVWKIVLSIFLSVYLSSKFGNITFRILLSTTTFFRTVRFMRLHERPPPMKSMFITWMGSRAFFTGWSYLCFILHSLSIQLLWRFITVIVYWSTIISECLERRWECIISRSFFNSVLQIGQMKNLVIKNINKKI